MGVRKEEYNVIGVKFNQEEYLKLNTGDKSLQDILEEYSERESKERYIIYDGMSGEYLLFGIIEQLSDGWNGNIENIIEFNQPSVEQFTHIVTMYNKIFPDNVIPMIKNYYVPHFV